MSATISVLIVGAGPAGLTMAAELARHGIRARIIDKRTQATSTSNALGIQSRTLDVWQDMGITQQALSKGNIIHGLRLFNDKRHLLTLKLEKLSTQYPFILTLPQTETEALLTHLLSEKYNVTVERGIACVDLTQHADHVDVVCQRDSGATENITCQWVIAADGHDSALRQLTNTPFVGHALEKHFMMVDCQIDWPLLTDRAHGFLTKNGMMAVLPMKDRKRIIFDITHIDELINKDELCLADFQQLANQRCYFATSLTEPTWLSRFAIAEKQVEHYRKQHVFFVGDAAHVHSPVGGQGLNIGIQDAHNLAWKLAFVTHGYATENLLDTYHVERYPIAQAVLKSTTKATKMITLDNIFLQWARNNIVLRLAALPGIRKRLLAHIAQIDTHYQQGIINQQTHKRFFYRSPKPGYRVINHPVKMDKETLSSFNQIIETCRFKLILFTGRKPNRTVADINTVIEGIAAHYAKQIGLFCVTTDPQYHAPWALQCIYDERRKLHRYFGCQAGGMYLLRPDNVVALRDRHINLSSIHQLLDAYLIET